MIAELSGSFREAPRNEGQQPRLLRSGLQRDEGMMSDQIPAAAGDAGVAASLVEQRLSDEREPADARQAEVELRVLEDAHAGIEPTASRIEAAADERGRGNNGRVAQKVGPLQIGLVTDIPDPSAY